MADEVRVPVLAVLKNGAILKNIFIVDNPSVIDYAESADPVKEEILNVGRHPDCHIELTHPSISRFHLQIFSKPSLKKLSVMDLSSAHGTWVLDKRIEPGVKVELNEGDTLRVGSSSRVYRLHWVPLNQAYDLEHLFVSALDVSFVEEQEEESENNEEEIIVGAHQGDLPRTEHGESRCDEDVLQERLEEILPLEEEKVETLDVEGEIVEAHQNDLLKIEIGEFGDYDYEYPHQGVAEEISVCAAIEVMECTNDEEIVAVYQIDNEEFGENKDPLEQIENDIFCANDAMKASQVGNFLQSAYQEESKEEIYQEISDPSPIVLEEAEGSKFDAENPILLPDLTSELELLSEMESMNITCIGGNGSISNTKLHEHCQNLNIQLEEEHEERDILVGSCLSGQNVLSDVTGRHLNKENQTSIWSRRGKPVGVLQLQTGRKSRKSRSSTGFNAENRHQIKENAENNFVVRDLFAELDREEEEEVFTPDKENMTPYTRKLKFMKDIGKFEEDAFHYSDKETANSKPLRGSNLKNFSSPVICPEDDLLLHSSDKQNQTPEAAKPNNRARPASRSCLRLLKGISEVKGIRERLPFQSLDVKSKSSPESGTSSDIVHKVAAEGKRSCWIMVADTSSFLDKESWKSLQLLQGLRGTQLIIPRIVIRELDSVRRQFSLFRRTTKVSSVLEWIEEAMVNSNWWIHIQSSAEEGRSIAPTPTATTWPPRFSSFANFDEVVSPTAEDHILEYALFFRRMKNTSANVVLLSNDISLKIKAMAEGLLCETPQEFRDSLVSPFSDRFMWTESCPRGRTWKEYSSRLRHMKKPPSQDAKGLKLILLHNAQYRHINSFN